MGEKRELPPHVTEVIRLGQLAMQAIEQGHIRDIPRTRLAYADLSALSCAEPPAVKALTSKQKTELAESAHGATAVTAAQSRKVTPRSTGTVREVLFRNLGVHCMEHAVRRGVNSGSLKPSEPVKLNVQFLNSLSLRDVIVYDLKSRGCTWAQAAGVIGLHHNNALSHALDAVRPFLAEPVTIVTTVFGLYQAGIFRAPGLIPPNRRRNAQGLAAIIGWAMPLTDQPSQTE